MEKKRIAILAVILFLLIGLGTFVFANPSQEEDRLKEEEGSGKVVREEKEDDDSDTDILETTDDSEDALVDTDTTATTYRTVGNGTTVGNDNGSSDQSGIGGTDVDDAYTKALEAVIKAENSLTQTDVNTAQDLVDAVKDSTQKQELMDRLEKVQDIIDATKLVEQLEKLVNEATNKEDMNGARDYRVDSKVEEIVDALTNSDSKTDLTNRLEELASILNDTEAPKVSTSPAQEVTKDNVTLSVEDANEVTIVSKLNGQVMENPETYTEEGVYEVTVTDEAFNETTITFTIDKTAPVFEGLKNGIYYADDITVNVNDLTLDKITAKVYATNEEIELENGATLSQESIYYLTATDKAGNSTSIYVAVDKTAPVFTNIQNGHQYNKDIEVQVEDLKVKTIEVYSYKDKTTKVVENGYVLSEEGTYRLTATDYAGHTTTIWVTIDKTAPEITGFEDGAYTAGNEIVYVKDDNLYKVTINDQEYKVNESTFAKKLGSDGHYTITATDKAGNTTTKSVTVDKTAPVFTSIKNGLDYNQDIEVIVEDDNLDKIELYNYNDKTTTIIENGTVLTEEGIYKITATDKAGNKTIVYVEIDKTAPSITGFEDGSYTNKNEIVYVQDSSLYKVTINGEEYEHDGKYFEKKFTHEGTYTVVAKDQAGNTTTKTVTIDKTAPVFEDLKNGIYYQNDIIVNVTDDHLDKITAKVYATNEEIELENGSKLSQESIYYLTATDKAGNSTSIYVAVDKTNPIFTTIQNGHQYNKDIEIQVEDLKVKTIEVYSYKDKTTKVVENGYVLSEKGTYRLTATDYADHTTTIWVTIDKTKPQATKVQVVNNTRPDSTYIKNGETVRVRAVFDEKLKTNPVLTMGDYQTTFEKISGGNGEVIYTADIKIDENESILAEGELTFTITGYKDYAGNEGDVVTENSVKSNLIYDRTLPTATLTYSTTDYINGNVLVTLTASEEVKLIDDTSWDIKEGYATVYKKAYPMNVDQTITFEDKAGNRGTVHLVINNIDKTKPVFEDPQKTMESDVTINVIEENLDKILVTDKLTGETYEVENGYVLTKEGYYKIIAYDKAGNQSDVWNLTIDNAAPVITIENARENNYYNHDVKVNISDIELNQTYLDGKRMGRTDALTVTEEGTHTVYAVDNYGHKSEEITFTVDKTQPTININNWVTLTKNVGDTYVDEGATATDNIDGDLTNKITVEYVYYDEQGIRYTPNPTEIKLDKPGQFVIIYKVTDQAGNKRELSRRINVVGDITAPVLEGVESNQTYYGSINYNMYDNKGEFVIYYDLGHHYQTCEELMSDPNVQATKISVNGSYTGTYPIMGDYDGVSVCLVDNANNKTFYHNISLRK